MNQIKNISATRIGETVNVLLDGQMIKKTFANKEQSAEFYRDILNYRNNPTEELKDQILAKINKKYRLLKADFLEYCPNDGEFYLKGYNIPMPTLLGETIDDYLEYDFPTDGLVKFWKWLMRNPDTHIRESLFDFLSKYNFTINDEGYFMAYKGVVLKKEDEELNSYIEHAYKEVKSALWKSNPSKYVVYRTDSDEEKGKLGKTKMKTWERWMEKDSHPEHILIGNLKSLYDALEDKKDSEELVYTDKWTGTMDIVLGEKVQMDRDLCNNNPDETCSAGLHVGSSKYAQTYVTKTDTVLAVLVNPMHVVSIPNAETDKMRCCEYFPVAVAERDEDDKLIVYDERYYNNDYSSAQIEDIEEVIEEMEEQELDNVQEIQLSALKDRLIELKKTLSDNS